MTACSKCNDPLTQEEIKLKIICDFCNHAHCLGCSKLSASEAHVTRLSKQRVLLFACKDCLPMVNDSVKSFTSILNSVLDSKLSALKADMDRSLMKAVKELEAAYAKQYNSLKDMFSRELADPKQVVGNVPEQVKASKADNSSKPLITKQQVANAVRTAQQHFNELPTNKKQTTHRANCNNQSKSTESMVITPSEKLNINITGTGNDSNVRAAEPGSGDCVIGSADYKPDSSISAAAPMSAFHLSNVNITVTEDNVKTHITKLAPFVRAQEVVVNKLRSNGRSNTFKIIVPDNCLDAILKPENWPKDIHLKEWRYTGRNIKSPQVERTIYSRLGGNRRNFIRRQGSGRSY